MLRYQDWMEEDTSPHEKKGVFVFFLNFGNLAGRAWMPSVWNSAGITSTKKDAYRGGRNGDVAVKARTKTRN
jgi:hypothetical protein